MWNPIVDIVYFNTSISSRMKCSHSPEITKQPEPRPREVTPLATSKGQPLTAIQEPSVHLLCAKVSMVSSQGNTNSSIYIQPLNPLQHDAGALML